MVDLNLQSGIIIKYDLGEYEMEGVRINGVLYLSGYFWNDGSFSALLYKCVDG